MKNKKNNSQDEEIISSLVDTCISFSKEADDILNYYLLSIDAVRHNYEKKKNDYADSFKIMDLFNSVYDCKTEDEKAFKLEEISNEQITNKYILSDILDIEFKNDTISFGFKKIEFSKYDPTKARSIEKETDHMFVAAKTSMLSNAIITFEKFLASFYRDLIYLNPCLYFDSKTVCMQELFTKNFNELIYDKIDELIEADMYDSFELLKKIFEKENINTEKVNAILADFKEAYYRRNLYVHNDGYVNSTYLSKIKDSKYKIGDYLSCGEEYFRTLTTNIKCLIFFITHSILAKVGYNDKNLEPLESFYFSELKEKNYQLTKYVYHLLSTHRSFEFALRMIFEVNYLISLKAIDEAEFKKEFSSFDVSAADYSFKIAKYVLEGKFKEAHSLIEEHYNSSDTPKQLIDWPLYNEFRTTTYYKRIVNNHKSDFNDLKEVDDFF